MLTKSIPLVGIHYTEGIVWLMTLSILFDHVRQFIQRAAVRRWLDGLLSSRFDEEDALAIFANVLVPWERQKGHSVIPDTVMA